MCPFDLKSQMSDLALSTLRNPEKWRGCSPDHPPCALCKKVIRGVPLNLFSKKNNKALSFHTFCALPESRSILNDLPCKESGFNELGEIICTKTNQKVSPGDCGTCIENLPDYLVCINCDKRRECKHIDRDEIDLIEIRINEELVESKQNVK